MLNEDEQAVLLNYYRNRLSDLQDKLEQEAAQLNIELQRNGDLIQENINLKNQIPVPGQPHIPFSDMKEFISFLRKNQKIECIKQIRFWTQCPLKEAKELYEELVPQEQLLTTILTNKSNY